MLLVLSDARRRRCCRRRYQRLSHRPSTGRVREPSSPAPRQPQQRLRRPARRQQRHWLSGSGCHRRHRRAAASTLLAATRWARVAVRRATAAPQRLTAAGAARAKKILRGRRPAWWGPLAATRRCTGGACGRPCRRLLPPPHPFAVTACLGQSTAMGAARAGPVIHVGADSQRRRRWCGSRRRHPDPRMALEAALAAVRALPRRACRDLQGSPRPQCRGQGRWRAAGRGGAVRGGGGRAGRWGGHRPLSRRHPARRRPRRGA